MSYELTALATFNVHQLQQPQQRIIRYMKRPRLHFQLTLKDSKKRPTGRVVI